MMVSQLSLAALPWAFTVGFVSVASPAGGGLPEDAITRGEVLMREAGCTACHAAPSWATERLLRPAAPSLANARERLAPDWIRRFLLRPHEVRAGTVMPDLLGALEEAEGERAAEELADFLSSLGEPLSQAVVRASAQELERGRELFHTIGCISCHEPQESAEELEQFFWDVAPEGRASGGAVLATSPPVHAADLGPLPTLNDLGLKTTVPSLTRFLLDPTLTRESGRMPHLKLSQGEAQAIALYLLRSQALSEEGGLEFFPGLAYEYFEAGFQDQNPDFDALRAERIGEIASIGVLDSENADAVDTLPDHRDDGFGFRFRGFLHIEHGGSYRFSTTSDDGSMLWIDDELIVDNNGHHAPRRADGEAWLSAGKHAFELTFFESGGGERLEVTLRPPGGEEREIRPGELFRADLAWVPPTGTEAAGEAERIAAGRARFGNLGCNHCHAGLDSDLKRFGRPLVELKSNGGCLSTKAVPELPHFSLDGDELASIRAALAALAGPPTTLEAEARLDRELEAFRCTACHTRAGRGGPDQGRLPHFISVGERDMGNEGRFPPTLDRSGAKLRPAWMREVISDGVGIRPYLATRMPAFGDQVAASIGDVLQQVDGTEAGRTEPAYSYALAKIGAELVGINGLGCIQCHGLGDYPALGIQAVDLAGIHDRIQPGWFRQLLLDPKSVGMNSRMPEFLVDGRSPVRDVFDGDPGRQADAIRAYLSLGSSMPLPEGLVADGLEYELIPLDKPITVSVFMKGVSPRVLLVGHPEGVHAAFDVENSRLVQVWNGRFFNAEGTWHGRAGKKELPGEGSMLEFPRKPVLAQLQSEIDTWPTAIGRPGGFRAIGRGLDEAGRPVFEYSLGELRIEESLKPIEIEAGEPLRARVTRRVAISGSRATEGMTLLAFEGDSIRLLEPGWFALGADVALRVPPGADAYLQDTGESIEIRIPVAWSKSQAHDSMAWTFVIEMEFSW